jgi:hypothetical protein
MSFGAWSVRSPCSEDSLMTVAKEISDFKLDVVRVQEVR